MVNQFLSRRVNVESAVARPWSRQAPIALDHRARKPLLVVDMDAHAVPGGQLPDRVESRIRSRNVLIGEEFVQRAEIGLARHAGPGESLDFRAEEQTFPRQGVAERLLA